MSLVKVDYRFEEIDYGKSVDDAEYYYSAITVGVDYDLDFSNQMEGVENRYLNKENIPNLGSEQTISIFSSSVKSLSMDRISCQSLSGSTSFVFDIITYFFSKLNA